MEAARWSTLEKSALWIVFCAVVFWMPGRRGRPSFADSVNVGCGPFFVIIGVAAVMGCVGWLLRRVDERKRYGIYANATANRPGVEIVTGRTVERDIIRMPGPPCPATVRYFHHTLAGRAGTYTEFVAAPPPRAGAMRVSSPAWHEMLSDYYGGRDLTIGEPDFDTSFLIQSNPPEFAPAYLDVPTREVIRSLNRHSVGDFLLQIRPGQLLVRVATRLEEGRALERFVANGYELVTRLSIDVSGGVELGAPAVAEGARCPVCGAKLGTAPRVLCRKCATPHHAECWSYNDGCSTFACGERRSRRA